MIASDIGREGRDAETGNSDEQSAIQVTIGDRAL
jgi:hypothetical protein